MSDEPGIRISTTESTEIHGTKESQKGKHLKISSKFPANCDGFFRLLSVSFRAFRGENSPSSTSSFIGFLARCRIVAFYLFSVDLFVCGNEHSIKQSPVAATPGSIAGRLPLES